MRNRCILLVILGLLLATVVLHAQQPEILGSAEEVIARAEARGANRDYDAAIQLLQEALDRFPTYPRMYLSLARWQEIRNLAAMSVSTNDFSERKTLFKQELRKHPDEVRDLFETYGRATMYVPDAGEIQRQITDLTEQDLPVMLGEYGPLALPGEPMPLQYSITDPQLPVEKRGVYQGLITTHPLRIIAAEPGDPYSGLRARYATDPKYGKEPKYARDPKYGGWVFTNALYAYEFDAHKHCWNLRFRVMWQDVPPTQQENRARLARYSAQLLLRLSSLLHAYTGLSPLFAPDGVVNVWLAEKGDAGGEAYNENIYLQEVGVPRAPGEWVRELAHEYGHQTFPVVGGYVKPEWGANGYLGERLYQRWLLLNLDLAGETHPWMRSLNAGDIKDNRIARNIRQFAALGPEAPAMTATDANAMDAFIGMALYLEETQGAANLADMLKSMTTPAFIGPNGFRQSAEAIEAYLQSIAQPVVTLRLADLPASTPLWVYLTDGAWQGELETRDNTTLAMKVQVDGKETKLDLTAHFTTDKLRKGWHHIDLVPNGDEKTQILSLKLVRRNPPSN